MNDFSSANTRLRDAILEAADEKSLRSVRLQIVALSSAERSVLPFEQKRINNAITELFKLADSKLALISAHTFFFEGDPGAPQTASLNLHDSKDTAPSSLQLTYKELKGVKVSVPKNHSEHCLISDVSGSIVSTGTGLELASVHLSNVYNSIIQISCKGPIFIHDVRHLILICSCHQLRLRNVHDLRVYAEKVGNDRMVLEDCDGLLVGYKDGKPAVDDFNWPNRGQENPHFKYCQVDDCKWIQELADGPLTTLNGFPFDAKLP